jgi:hypothetical protein
MWVELRPAGDLLLVSTLSAYLLYLLRTPCRFSTRRRRGLGATRRVLGERGGRKGEGRQVYPVLSIRTRIRT